MEGQTLSKALYLKQKLNLLDKKTFQLSLEDLTLKLYLKIQQKQNYPGC